ncbi:MAG: biotin--[acetyl-CoA-carboxylase] ligase [Akkermansiaceae bacterium]
MFDLRQFGALAPEWYERIHYHHELESTNDAAHDLAACGAEHGTLVLADHQTAGRGRRGAQWTSAPGDGLLFSLVLRPSLPKLHWSRLALSTGLGLAEALQDKWQITAHVKWPNDIYISERKCAGILVEARDDHVVIGMGINVLSAPTVSNSRISAIAMAEATSKPLSRERVLAVLLPAIMHEVNGCADHFETQLNRLRGKCYLTDKRIRFRMQDAVLDGLVRGIGPDGILQVEVDGELKGFSQASDIDVL